MWLDLIILAASGVISFVIWYPIGRLARHKTRREALSESFMAAGCVLFLVLFEVII